MGTELTQIPDFVMRMSNRAVAMFEDARTPGKAMPNTISTRGGRFSLVENGDRRPAPNPIKLEFVIVALKKPFSRGYYAGKFDASADNYNPPACYSVDSVTPEDDVPEMQNPTCRGCKWSEWGSATNQNGNETTACKQHKQLVVKLVGAPGLWLLNVPMGSKKFWDKYVAMLEVEAKEAKAKYKVDIGLASFVTGCEFNENPPNTLNFTALGWGSQFLNAEEQELVFTATDPENPPPEIKTMLWGAKGADREAQYLSGSPKPVARVALPNDADTPGQKYMTAAKPVYEDTRPYSKKSDATDPLGAMDDYVPPGEPAPAAKRTRKASTQPIVTSAERDANQDEILKGLGLENLDI